MQLVKKNPDFISENVISNPEIFERRTFTSEENDQVIEKRCFSDDGLFSQKVFGDLECEDEFTCKCGKYKGKLFEGVVCEKCGEEVKSVGANIDKVGWIDLGDNYLIKAIPYGFLQKIIGSQNLENIIMIPPNITIDGELDTETINAVQNESPEKKYWYIGLKEFYLNYSVILDYYFELNHKSDEEIFEKKKREKKRAKKENREENEVETEKSKADRDIYHFVELVCDVFTNKIMVLPATLRPGLRTADGLKLDEININYMNILKNVEILKDPSQTLPLIKEITTEILQSQYLQLSEIIINNIKSKSGLIRNQICGARVNFSARNIVTPSDEYMKIDEVQLPYITFLELYKYEIINIVKRIKGCTYIEAERIHYRALLKMDPEIVSIINKFIHDEDIEILLNRNPSIAFGSILCLRVSGINKDFSDQTVKVNNLYISLMNADYDGDGAKRFLEIV